MTDYMMKVDKKIDLSAFQTSSLDFVGYKVMLRNVKTAELMPVYYNTYHGYLDAVHDFRYVIGQNIKAKSLPYRGKVHGIYVFSSLKDAQRWGYEMQECWCGGLWQPVVVEVVVKIDNIFLTGVNAAIPMAMAVVNEVFVIRIVEHLRRVYYER